MKMYSHAWKTHKLGWSQFFFTSTIKVMSSSWDASTARWSLSLRKKVNLQNKWLGSTKVTTFIKNLLQIYYSFKVYLDFSKFRCPELVWHTFYTFGNSSQNYNFELINHRKSEPTKSLKQKYIPWKQNINS